MIVLFRGKSKPVSIPMVYMSIPRENRSSLERPNGIIMPYAIYISRSIREKRRRERERLKQQARVFRRLPSPTEPEIQDDPDSGDGGDNAEGNDELPPPELPPRNNSVDQSEA